MLTVLSYVVTLVVGGVLGAAWRNRRHEETEAKQRAEIWGLKNKLSMVSRHVDKRILEHLGIE